MIVTNWTGVEVKALRLAALRRTQKDFAALSGFSLAVIRKWEGRGGSITLSGEFAEGMDTLFRRLDEKQRARFQAALAADLGASQARSRPNETDDNLQFGLRKPESVDLKAIARLRNLIADLDESYGNESSASLLAQAGQYLGQARIFQNSAPSESIRRELFAVEAQAANLMSRLVWDASQRRDNSTAHHYLNQSIAAARKLGDVLMEAQANLRQSYIALYGEKDPVQGLELTERVADIARHLNSELTGVALLHRAEAFAMLGREVDCEKSLSTAERYFDRIAHDQFSLGLHSETQHARLASSCYLSLGKAKRAQTILESAVEQCRDGFKTRAIMAGNLSLSYIRQHSMDEAAHALHQAIDLVEQTRGGAGLNIVFTACRELQPYRNIPTVRDTYDRVLALMTTT
ncbi:helix-turn-helix domain-containing protein [Nocardia sp. NPDC003482]